MLLKDGSERSEIRIFLFLSDMSRAAADPAVHLNDTK